MDQRQWDPDGKFVRRWRDNPDPEAGQLLAARLTRIANDKGLTNAAIGRAVREISDGAVNPIEMRVSRWLSGGTPLIDVKREFFALCAALELDPITEITAAVQAMIDRQPSGAPMWVDPTEARQ